MATARPGWSRRAQYGLFFSFLAVIAGIVVGLILLVLSLVAPKSYETVRGAALDVTAPVTGALSEVTATVEGLFTGAGDYWNAANQNAELKRERRALMQRMVEARAIVQENKQLRERISSVESSVAATGGGEGHTVQPGDTLASIAARYGTTAQAIADANGIANPNQIAVGQVLVIPGR